MPPNIYRALAAKRLITLNRRRQNFLDPLGNLTEFLSFVFWMLTFCGHAHVLWSCSCFVGIEQKKAYKVQKKNKKRARKKQEKSKKRAKLKQGECWQDWVTFGTTLRSVDRVRSRIDCRRYRSCRYAQYPSLEWYHITPITQVRRWQMAFNACSP